MILNCNNLVCNAYQRIKNSFPTDRVSILNRLSFWWITSVIFKANKFELPKNLLWNLTEKDQSEYFTREFEAIWNPKAQKYMSSMKDIKSNEANTRLATETDLFLEEPRETRLSLKDLQNAIRRPSLFFTLFQTIFMRYLSASFFKFFREMLMLFGPFVLE